MTRILSGLFVGFRILQLRIPSGEDSAGMSPALRSLPDVDRLLVTWELRSSRRVTRAMVATIRKPVAAAVLYLMAFPLPRSR